MKEYIPLTNRVQGPYRKLRTVFFFSFVPLAYIGEKRGSVSYFIIWEAPREGKMNQIARYDWLPEGARCGAILPARDYTLGIKLPRKPYNKSFIEKVCSVKMDGYWPRSFLANLWASTSSRSINMQKKELGQYPAILTPHLVNNPYVQTEKTRLVRYWLYLLCAWLVQERFLFPRNGFKFLMHVESITSQIEVVFKSSTRFTTQFLLK